jgi:hypothetical protein
VVVQVSGKYYFYRGIANRKYLNTSELSFGEDISDILEVTGVESIVEPRAKRLINLEDSNAVLLPTSGRIVKPQDLKSLFEGLPVDKIPELKEDIAAAVPQLQTLLSQTELLALSKALIAALSTKVKSATEPMKNAYIRFLTEEYDSTNSEHVKKKGDMLGKLKKQLKALQKSLETAKSSLANMMSSQTTSKRTHDLNRLLRQTTIQNNVETVRSMTFETLASLLETHAADMGVMVMNVSQLACCSISLPAYFASPDNIFSLTIKLGNCPDDPVTLLATLTYSGNLQIWSTPYWELLETLEDKSISLDAE